MIGQMAYRMQLLTEPLRRTGHMIAMDAADVIVRLREKQIDRVLLAVETAVWEQGLAQDVVSALEMAGIAWQRQQDSDGEDAPALVAVGGDEAVSFLQAGRGLLLHLPRIVTADGASCLHLLAHAVEAALNPVAPGKTQAMAAEAAAGIIRWMRTAAQSAQDDLAHQSMQQAAYQTALARRGGMCGHAHAMAAAIASRQAPDAPADWGHWHERATAAALDTALTHYAAQDPRALAALSQSAGLASQGTVEEVSVAALLAWLRETMEIFGLPRRFDELPRRDVPQAAAQALRACHPRQCGPSPVDRFTLEHMLMPLAAPQEPAEDTSALVEMQRQYFHTHATLPTAFRADALHRLRMAIQDHEFEITRALQQDLGKGSDEAYLCEIGMVLSELSHMQWHLGRYTRNGHVPTPLHQFPARSYVHRRPYGVTLIMSPWNYPFLLTMGPLIGAVAAGNCCVVKPSAYAPCTSRIIRDLCAECFPQEHVAVVEGGRQQNQALLDQHFDKIFFTGGEQVGREVLRRAAEHLTPVTLELGGKSPVVVDETAKVDLAAKRVAFGKLLNAGQTCVAPDYVLVHRSVKNEFVDCLKKHLTAMAGDNALHNDGMVHMISRRHYDRVMALIDREHVVYGGRGDKETLRIQPTIMDNVTPEHAVMQEEIFGPVLPVLEVESLQDAMDFIAARPTPLACYLFTESRAAKQRFVAQTAFGGGCINDTIIHLASSRLPFGGLGRSGMGRYHGRYSYECFSHASGVVDKSTLIDLPMRYSPYHDRMMALIRLFLR